MMASDNASPGPQHDEVYLRRQDSGIQEFFFRELTVVQRVTFWETTRQWFLQQGYALYDYRDVHPADADLSTSCFMLIPSSAPRTWDGPKDADILPFASNGVPPLDAWTVGMVFYAQDAQGHHLAMKYVQGRSQEHEILKFLRQQYAMDPASCKGILPILDLISHEDDWFVIMPRWGEIDHDTRFYTAQEALDHTEYLLEAVNFLHCNRIVHRDIHALNILTNHFQGVGVQGEDPEQAALRAKGLLAVALFDFDISVIMPPGSHRLPWKFGTEGLIFYRPPDIAQGECEYDPFAFDVCCLGNLLLTMFSNIDPLVPMLAPLLAGMTFPDPSVRFTAEQSLVFFRRHRAELTTEELHMPLRHVVKKPNFLDPWHGLDDAFVAKWAKLRAPPPSLLTQILRYICRYKWVHRTIVRLHQGLRWARTPFAKSSQVDLKRSE